MDSNNISNLDRFSWTTTQNGAVAKELDYSCFKYGGSGIPQEYYSFFRVNLDKQSNEITIRHEDLSYNCELKWTRPKSPIVRIFWDDNFTDLLKSKFPHWEEIVPHQKLTNMKLIFSRTEESNVFSIDFLQSKKFVGWSEEELSSELFETKVEELITRKFLEKPPGKKYPTNSVSVTSSYSRDVNVVAWVLRESKGVCELCRGEAPFEKPNGRFYLEVHHLKRLADGGSDTPENAIAICPNCHKELHFGQHKSILLKKVFTNVKRLVRE